jgi:hypothetical protein
VITTNLTRWLLQTRVACSRVHLTRYRAESLQFRFLCGTFCGHEPMHQGDPVTMLKLGASMLLAPELGHLPGKMTDLLGH